MFGGAHIRKWTRRSRHLAAAAALHLMLFGGLSWHVLYSRSAPQPEPVPVVIDVELFAAAPRSDPATAPEAESADDVAAEAEPLPVREVPSPVPDEAQPVPSSVPSRDAREGISAELAAAESAADEESETTVAAVAATPDTPAAGLAPVTHDGQVPDTELLAWERSILKHLDAHKRYPARAQHRGQEDVVMLHVHVDRHGEVLSRRIVASRGYALLDREALALLDRSSPLPSPPDRVGASDLEFRIPVAFHIRQRIVRDR